MVRICVQTKNRKIEMAADSMESARRLARMVARESCAILITVEENRKRECGSSAIAPSGNGQEES